jgi:hypothetical protein
MKEYLIKVIRRIFKSPFSIPYLLFSILICKIRSKYYTYKIDSGGGKIIITKPFINFKINKHKTSELSINGNFRIIPHLSGNSPVVISMGMNSKFIVGGDFMVGQGVMFGLGANSILSIGGKYLESDSGITADTRILVYRKIEIGKDFICAWNVLITDSDWHQISGQEHHADIRIGDHVWIANSNNILKGSTIGNNCIVASNSKIMNKIFPDNVLIGGIPPKILKANISWNRDI